MAIILNFSSSTVLVCKLVLRMRDNKPPPLRLQRAHHHFGVHTHFVREFGQRVGWVKVVVFPEVPERRKTLKLLLKKRKFEKYNTSN